MTVTNGRNLAGFAALINDSGKVIAEAFSTDLAAATRPTVYDSDGDVPFDAPKGSQAYVASEGLLLKLTDAAWYVLDGSEPAPELIILTGSTSGYVSSGFWTRTAIVKFPFAASTTTTLVGQLTVSHAYNSGTSSKVSGYSAGGEITNVINKWPFAADGNATDVGDLTVGRYGLSGANSETYGYAVAGVAIDAFNIIEKYPFAVDANATDIGDLTAVTYYTSAVSSETAGYVTSGQSYTSDIRKWSFVSDGNATNVGNATVAGYWRCGIFSVEHGYTVGGRQPGNTNTNVIDRFPFATDGNAVDVGDLITPRAAMSGSSATTHGYTVGGYAATTSITRFSHAALVTDESVGSISQHQLGAGHQI
jgi:hypothetical protein